MPHKLSKNNLLAGSAVYLISNLLYAAIPFALLPILTRYLSPSEYGQVAIFQTTCAALSALTGLSVYGAANRKYYDNESTPEDLRHFIGACLQVLFFSSLIVFIAIVLFGAPLASWLALEKRWVLGAVIASAAAFVVNIRLGQWQVRKQATKYGAMQVSQSLLNASLSLLLVVYFADGAAGRIQPQIWAPAIFAAISLIYLYKDKLVVLSWKPDYLREALAFGIPLVPHAAGLFFLNFLDRIVINKDLGVAAAGIYMVAVQLCAVMGIMFDAINKAYVPWLFERLQRDVTAEKHQIVKYTYLYFFAVLLMACMAFIVGPYVIHLVAGPQYQEAGHVIGWIALGQALNGMYLMVTNYIFFSKRTGLLSLATITSGALNIVLLLLLVKLLGLKGAALAFAISMSIRFALTWWVAQLSHPMPWFKFKLEN